jgi:hypothetical protein
MVTTRTASFEIGWVADRDRPSAGLATGAPPESGLAPASRGRLTSLLRIRLHVNV